MPLNKRIFSRHVDLASALLVLIAISGVIWSPKMTNYIKTLNYPMSKIKITVDLHNIPLANPKLFINQVINETQTSIVIRNQPSGNMIIDDISLIRLPYFVTKPEFKPGSRYMYSPENHRLRFQLSANGYLTDNGFIIGGTALKLGSPITLEGKIYRLPGIVSGISTK